MNSLSIEYGKIKNVLNEILTSKRAVSKGSSFTDPGVIYILENLSTIDSNSSDQEIQEEISKMIFAIKRIADSGVGNEFNRIINEYEEVLGFNEVKNSKDREVILRFEAHEHIKNFLKAKGRVINYELVEADKKIIDSLADRILEIWEEYSVYNTEEENFAKKIANYANKAREIR